MTLANAFGVAEMTPDEMKAARTEMGLSADRFAKLVQVESGRTVRRWEAAERDIPGPVQVLVRALIASSAVRCHFGITLASDLAGNDRPQEGRSAARE